MNVKAEVYYPDSDGKPMGESDLHRNWMSCIISRLQRHFAGQRVYVSGNLLIYYEEGNPRRLVVPDAFVVLDVDPHERRVYKLWEEKVPHFVLETTSSTTRREDQKSKLELYARLGIKEYFLYDPLGDWLDPPLLGYRLRAGKYSAIKADGDGAVGSRQLGLTFQLEDGQLEMYDTATRKRLLSGDEAAEEMQRLTQELQRREREAKREAKSFKKLADEAERKADEAERKAGDAERKAGDAERLLAEERQAREALEAEIARLRRQRLE